MTHGREEGDWTRRRWLLGSGHQRRVPKEASDVCGEPDKAGGAGAVRAERGWSATLEVERWEGEDPEHTGEASAGSGLQNVALGS